MTEKYRNDRHDDENVYDHGDDGDDDNHDGEK